MTAIDLNELIQRRRVRDCIAIKVSGPCCPLCHAVADDPEHGANRTRVTSPGKFEGQREILRDAYHLWLEGGGDETGPDEETGLDRVTVIFDDGTHVSFVEDDQGFIREVPNPS